MSFVNITYPEMKAFLRPAKGWYEVKGHSEYVFQCPISFMPVGTVLKVWTGISVRTNMSRNKGADAIRVCVVSDEGNGKGILATSHVKRVTNWKQNLIDRIVDTYSELKKMPKRQMVRDHSVWVEHDGIKSCDISTLSANKLCTGSSVALPDGTIFNLQSARKDWNDDEIAGWNFTANGQKYLVIND